MSPGSALGASLQQLWNQHRCSPVWQSPQLVSAASRPTSLLSVQSCTDPPHGPVSCARMERLLAKRAALVPVAGLAMVGAWAFAQPGRAEARENLLAGSPRIDTVRALAPKRGRHAGRLVVWTRVIHPRGTRRALARERPESFHSARVVARVGKASRVAREHLDLGRRRLAEGYHFRFPRSAVRAAQAGGRGRVLVSVSLVQTVDLDSDGDSEDRARAAAVRRVPLARPAVSIEPRDGYFVNGAGDNLLVSGGKVVAFVFSSGTASPCGVGPADYASAPIDPQTGMFSFNITTTAGLTPPVNTTAQGTFTDTLSLTLDADVNWSGCTYHVPNSFSWSPIG
jgi:hypothetical protein